MITLIIYLLIANRNTYTYRKQSNIDKIKNFKIPRILKFFKPNPKPANLENTDFDFDQTSAPDQPDLIDFNSDSSSKEEYRSAYPMEKSNIPVNEYLHSLEGLFDFLINFFAIKIHLNLFLANASARQTSTIGRPQSKYSSSNFTLPVGYYEKTTPYADFNNIYDDDDDDESFNPFEENDDDFSEVVEAINPNVKV